MHKMIGKRICWEWRNTVRHGVVYSVIGSGEHEMYLVIASDGGRTVVACRMAHVTA
jgi:hypothetical protein